MTVNDTLTIYGIKSEVSKRDYDGPAALKSEESWPQKINEKV